MKGRITLLCFTVLFIFLAGCQQTTVSPIRVASSPWPGYEPLYLARDLGFIDSNYVHLFELPSSDITMESFRNGSTDIATLTLDETMSLIHDGVKLKILLVMDISHGGDAVLARPGINKPSDIKGKRVSIVNIPLGLYMLSRLLEVAGLDEGDVTVYPMPESRQLNAYLNNDVDVVISFDPVKTQLMNAGANLIFDSSQIPNEIFDLIVVHEDVYQQRRDEVCQLIHGWFKSLDYMASNNSDAVSRIARRLKVSDAELRNMMTGIRIPDRRQNTEILAGQHPEIIPAAGRLSQIMLHEGLLLRPVSVEQSIDPEFANCYQ